MTTQDKPSTSIILDVWTSASKTIADARSAVSKIQISHICGAIVVIGAISFAKQQWVKCALAQEKATKEKEKAAKMNISVDELLRREKVAAKLNLSLEDIVSFLSFEF
jgi:hypothetical protein